MPDRTTAAGEPQCDFGRGPEECIPGPYIRTNDFPRIAVDRSNGTLFATWQDYRNGEYDVQLSTSTNGGATWQQATGPVNPDTGKDHYMPAVAVSPVSHRAAVSYYRSDRVPNENTTPTGGFAPSMPGVQAEMSDYSLSGGMGLSTPYTAAQVSPTFAPADGIQIGFNGDYSGLTVVGTTAHPIWSDTRNSALTGQGVIHDEDIFTESAAIP